ncbi:hypothetical protein SRB5_64780 [Streptomyces sp. RB5]|uniref:Lipoprotein n=1 Tax=Streptomyces smaragdinus TaxID=2585196 RepID=A0A7K0CS71_9ACTN|nr:hypothetical protein [Streptomyces smaragdinus]MQY16280.1 hypothetical protein [Streptomyces smaragdinus]
MAPRKNAPARLLPCALLVAALTTSAACSGGGDSRADRSAKDIGKEAVGAMRATESMTMRGDITPPAGGRSRLKLTVTRRGDCSGTITAAAPPSQVRVLVVDGASYMKPDRRYLEANAGGAEKAKVTETKIGGRWLKLDERSGADEFKGLCDLDRMLAGLTAGTTGSARKGDPAVVAGRRAIPITDSVGAKSTTAWVAAEGTPYILRLDSKGTSDMGTVLFSDFDAARPAKAPGPREFIDMAELNG